MNIIFKCIFGSRLFGTDLSTSDTDYKGVFIPSKKQILLGDYKAVISDGTNKDGKNSKEDIDTEFFSLKEYLNQLKNGQTNAIDMLFAKPLVTSPTWQFLYDNRSKILTNKSKSFVGYALAQAKIYNNKIDRVKKLKSVLDILHNIPSKDLISSHIDKFDSLIDESAIKIIEIDVNAHSDNVNYNKSVINHLYVCGKMIPETKVVKDAVELFSKMYDDYGHRAKESDTDWKSLYHAIRISQECVELLKTGTILQPRPNAEFLKKVRLGQFTYKECCDIVMSTVSEIDSIKSVLPAEPDNDWIDQFIYDVHYNEVLNA
jgi:RNA repair pathway DNA polymerase beta family